MPSKHFQSINDMASYQEDRELQEALRVQAMPSAERFVWLTETWGRLQDGATALFTDVPHPVGGARFYVSLEEKNLFDDDREIQHALRLRLSAQPS